MLRLGTLVVVASCGRVGFDPHATGDGAVGDGTTGNNIVFTTSTMHDGSLGGLAGADMLCAQRATAGGLPGHYVAWLSTSTVDAASRLVLPSTMTPARGWVRRDGRPVADTLSDLLSGIISYPIRIDEFGNDVGPDQHDVLSGTKPNGAFDASASQCANWTSNANTEQFSVGDAARTTLDWSDYYNDGCNVATWRLYCFGVDYNNPLPPVPAPNGRFAFVSHATFAANGGIAGADALCQSEAAGHLPGTYVALLATTQHEAAWRFDATIGTWYRSDNVPLAATGGDVLDFKLDTPLTTDASGNRTSIHVWTGAADPKAIATLGFDCNDWSSNSSGALGNTGKDSSSTSGFNDCPYTCDSGYPIYCFQQ